MQGIVDGEGVVRWLTSPVAWFGLTGLSVVLVVLSIWLVPRFLIRIPADYFLCEPELGHRTWTHFLRKAGRNVCGGILVMAGVAMLVLPGQGLLTLLAGLICLDFPGKHRLLRRWVARPRVLRALNGIRRRFHAPPLLDPHEKAQPSRVAVEDRD